MGGTGEDITQGCARLACDRQGLNTGMAKRTRARVTPLGANPRECGDRGIRGAFGTGVKDTVARIEQSIQYMHGTVWRDEKFLKVRHKCKNQHEE